MASRGPVAVVTGASRGIGKGVAIALGRLGCTVYVTGRSQQGDNHPLAGTVHDTADQVSATGGKGVAIVCDHADDAQVQALFERVRTEHGALDILVNSATALSDQLNLPGGFWEKPLSMGDIIDVGLRSSYVASWYAAPLLMAAQRGLIVFISASGAAHYSLGPAYGAQKAGTDKLAFDVDIDFRQAGSDVAAVSVWPGPVLTERFAAELAADPEKFEPLAAIAETPEFTGRLVWALFNDPALLEKSGGTYIGAELADGYGILDEGGRRPPSYRDTMGVAPLRYYPLIIS